MLTHAANSHVTGKEHLQSKTQRYAMMLELMERIIALPDPAIMDAEEKVKWLQFLSNLWLEVDR